MKDNRPSHARHVAQLYGVKAGMNLICAAVLMMTHEFFLVPIYVAFAVVCGLLAHAHVTPLRNRERGTGSQSRKEDSAGGPQDTEE